MKLNSNLAFVIVNEEDFELDKVTEILNIKPTETRKKGDVMGKSGYKIDFTEWSYDTKDSKRTDIFKHCAIILDMFGNKVNELKRIQKKFNVRLALVFKIEYHSEEKPSIILPTDFISFANKINAEISLAMYNYC